MSNYAPTGNPVQITRATSSLLRAEFNAIATALNSKGDIAGQTWTGTHDYTGGAIRVPTPNIATDAVNKSYADNLAISAVTPAQPGGTLPYKLRSQAGVASWVLDTLPISSRTSNAIISLSDHGTIINITANSFTQTFSAAATLGPGFWFYYINTGSGDITIPSSDGVSNWPIMPGEMRLFQCDGAAFVSFVVSAFIRGYAATSTFTKPPGYRKFGVRAQAGGGGGGSGRRGSTASDRAGGSGGSGGACAIWEVDSSFCAATETVSVGAGGSGGAAQTVDSTNGNPGIVGGNSSFGSHIVAIGGNPGTGGTQISGTGGAAVIGFPPNSTGGLGFNSSAGGSATVGGVNAGADSTGFGAAGGGSGAGQSTSVTTSRAGAASGAIVASTTTSGRNTALAAGAGGTTGGVAATTGTSAPLNSGLAGPGGGGGAYITATAGGAGARGAKYGGGGGGGAASDNGFNSGPGGAGEDGYATVWGIV